MAKIGTAHIEIKPVLDEATLELISERIAKAVADGVAAGMAEARRAQEVVFKVDNSIEWSPAYNPGRIIT